MSLFKNNKYPSIEQMKAQIVSELGNVQTFEQLMTLLYGYIKNYFGLK